VRDGRNRDDVLAAACAVVAERGAEATRFSDVTAASGVGVSTLQYYFGSREEMLRAVFRYAARADFAAVGEQLAGVHGAWERLVVVASYLTGAVDGDTSWRVWAESWRWALRDAELRADVLNDYQRWRELLAAEIDAGIREGAFTTDAAAIDGARQALALIDGLALPVVLGDPSMGREAARAHLVDALWRLVSRVEAAPRPGAGSAGRMDGPAVPVDAGAEGRPVEVTLRPARRDDVPAVAAIWAVGWRDGHLGNVPDVLLRTRTGESFGVRAGERVADTTVAVVGGVVAGFVMVVGEEVEQVYVDSSFRGSGVARVLLAEAERLVAAGGHANAWLAVVPGNSRARRFYERSGWVDAGAFDYEAQHEGGAILVPCRRYIKQVAQ